jgi:signal transduction histidine kinase/DNA-binding response OmpR family regulator/PAS domain-containing protein
MVALPKKRSNSIRPFDWTKDHAQANDFQRATREHVDWSASPMGRMAEWPASLRQFVLVAMADTAPSAVLWRPAPDTAIVYNEAFACLVGNKHPKLQGQHVNGQLVEYCTDFDATWDMVAGSGCMGTVRNQRIRQDRLGFVEEKTYHWKFLPILGDDGFVAGSLITVEDDDRVPPRRERSKSAVREIGMTLKGVIDRTAYQTATSTMRLHEHFSGKTCNCEKLWEATKQLELHQARFHAFAQYAPVGVANLNKDYRLEWANKAYYDVMSQPSEDRSFFDYLHPEDVSMAQGYFDSGAFRTGAFTFECRLKKFGGRPAVSPSESPLPLEPMPAWVLVSAYRENDDEQSTRCWIIDITAHKNAEDFLRKRMDEAVEMRQQKERFIDMISHEIRNPLSAMIHCTDDIISECSRGTGPECSEDVLEAAQTIAYCTKHIKNIVGDVLTLSKLDSRLVEICPVPTQARRMIEDGLKIFNGELRAGEIDIRLEVDKSIPELGVDWLLIDPGRTLQVLINLVTNAIKVVKDRSRREIKVKMSASERSPCENSDTITCVRPRAGRRFVDFGEHNQEPSIYLTITIEDTGPGMEDEELASLFERFAQENPKTESKYGGSGLGLFISRDLTELQGGRIGVASKPGVGSTFVFAVEAKRVPAPISPAQQPVVQVPAPVPVPTTLQPPMIAKPSIDDILSPSVPSSESKEHPPQTRHVPRITPPEHKPPLKVLVVEDNLINQKVLANQLRKRGYEVECALHGEQALEILHMNAPPSTSVSQPTSPTSSTGRPSLISSGSEWSMRTTTTSHSSKSSTSTSTSTSSNLIRRKPLPSQQPPPPPAPAPAPFDIVLMDIEMPIMDGLTCAQQIRHFEHSHPALFPRRLPILAVTANARSEHGQSALEAGMDAITTKPYQIAELVKQIQGFCGVSEGVR